MVYSKGQRHAILIWKMSWQEAPLPPKNNNLDWFAKAIERCNGIAEVMDLNPVQGWIIQSGGILTEFFFFFACLWTEPHLDRTSFANNGFINWIYCE